jgi:hypothetical protein
MKGDALIDMYAILTAGGRNSGEKSRALPQSAYRDPSETVKFRSELEHEKKLKDAPRGGSKNKRKQSKFKYREPK